MSEVTWTHEKTNDEYYANTRIDNVTARAVVDPDGDRAGATWSAWAFCANYKHDRRHQREGTCKGPDPLGEALNRGLVELLRVSREAAACHRKHPGPLAG
jgi:hypothetical protein